MIFCNLFISSSSDSPLLSSKVVPSLRMSLLFFSVLLLLPAVLRDLLRSLFRNSSNASPSDERLESLLSLAIKRSVIMLRLMRRRNERSHSLQQLRTVQLQTQTHRPTFEWVCVWLSCPYALLGTTMNQLDTFIDVGICN